MVPRPSRQLCLLTVLFGLAACTGEAPAGGLVAAGSAAVRSAEETPGTSGQASGQASGQVSGSQHGRRVVRALAVLHRWDRQRVAAYAAGDPARLRRLYAPASLAGARDVRLLRAYADRGVRVADLKVQVLEAHVLAMTEHLLRIEVVDRVAGGTAISDRSPRELPGSRPETRTVTFVAGSGGWRVRSVRRG